MSVDAERVYQGALTSQWAWGAPFVITVSIFLTIKVLGISGLVAAGMMICFMFFQVSGLSTYSVTSSYRN